MRGCTLQPCARRQLELLRYCAGEHRHLVRRAGIYPPTHGGCVAYPACSRLRSALCSRSTREVWGVTAVSRLIGMRLDLYECRTGALWIPICAARSESAITVCRSSRRKGAVCIADNIAQAFLRFCVHCRLQASPKQTPPSARNNLRPLSQVTCRLSERTHRRSAFTRCFLLEGVGGRRPGSTC
jgi:hypothetical protein